MALYRPPLHASKQKCPPPKQPSYWMFLLLLLLVGSACTLERSPKNNTQWQRHRMEIIYLYLRPRTNIGDRVKGCRVQIITFDWIVIIFCANKFSSLWCELLQAERQWQQAKNYAIKICCTVAPGMGFSVIYVYVIYISRYIFAELYAELWRTIKSFSWGLLLHWTDFCGEIIGCGWMGSICRCC